MIDLSTETVLSLSAAARTLPRLRMDRPIAPSTVWRWASAGLRGVRLETIRVGGTTCTSAEALQRFFEALNRNSAPASTATPAALAKRAEQAARALEALGI